MKKRERRKSNRLKFVLKIGVSVSVIAYLLYQIDFDALRALTAEVLLYIFLALLTMFGALVFMTLRWKYVLNLMKPGRYEWHRLFEYYLIGSFFNNIIPGSLGGDAVRLYYASETFHISKKLSFSAVLIERVAGLFALSLILMVSLFFNETIREKLHFGYPTIMAGIAATLLILIAARYYIGKTLPLRGMDLPVILLLSVLGQMGDILVSYQYALYYHLDLTVVNLMSIMPLVYIATVIPISLGGVGVREGVMTAGMALYGIDVPDAVMVSFLLYFTKILMGMSGWVLYVKTGKIHVKERVE
ncbi:lysylphosphatidylglycerol synthase transmembrane domain-containing protein [Hydrogenimonas sp. SS33]|uniref:lysylphosphatidylglycerol synthase transmembrane domain-containing protein n=1 Tax=Hydrogenimonas leucolamina TaxID=2954236 RepID=UPI00336C0B1B